MIFICKIHPKKPPPLSNSDLPILVKLSESYKLWHAAYNNIPRLTRYTIGAKIDQYFTDCIEDCLIAGYANKQQKLFILERFSNKLDALKYFLKLLWEIKGIPPNKYSVLSPQLVEIGKMVGGWIHLLKKETSRI